MPDLTPTTLAEGVRLEAAAISSTLRTRFRTMEEAQFEKWLRTHASELLRLAARGLAQEK